MARKAPSQRFGHPVRGGLMGAAGPRSGPARVRVALGCAAGALIALSGAGCGGSSSDDAARRAPSRSDFPKAHGRTLEQIASAVGQGKVVVSPAGRVFDVGPNRFPFGVFTLGGEQVDDADVALYFARGLSG